MTFTQIVTEVADRLNLTSDEALARIGRSVNERVKETVTSCGLATSVRGVVTAYTTIGDRYLTFVACEKLMSVFNPTAPQPWVLGERTFDTLRNNPLGYDPAQLYAIAKMQPTSVTIFLDCAPASSYALCADAYRSTVTLVGNQEPPFSENFHNAIVYGAMATEYDKMEKEAYANKMEAKYQLRLTELRYFIRTSAYLSIAQGLNLYNGLTQLPLISN